MDDGFVLDLAADVYSDIRRHLVPPLARQEEAAFVFARIDGEAVLRYIEWLAVPPDGFVHQSAYYIELTDEMRASAIKRAHDLEASLIEVHSHPFQKKARFSPSDWEGFFEFVPHVLWRLKRRPYAAIVFTRTSYDSLVWIADVAQSAPLRIRLDGDRIIEPNDPSDLGGAR